MQKPSKNRPASFGGQKKSTTNLETIHLFLKDFQPQIWQPLIFLGWEQWVPMFELFQGRLV